MAECGNELCLNIVLQSRPTSAPCRR